MAVIFESTIPGQYYFAHCGLGPTDWTKVSLPFTPNKIRLGAVSSKGIIGSFDQGVTTFTFTHQPEVPGNNWMIDFPGARFTEIWIKCLATASAGRVWAWR